ncbi:MAG: hypothetical protein JRN15_15315 [Nitrososphaerota archaeon]|nr:hypothetical protein [Nitrososphaerota archaeon]
MNKPRIWTDREYEDDGTFPAALLFVCGVMGMILGILAGSISFSLLSAFIGSGIGFSVGIVIQVNKETSHMTPAEEKLFSSKRKDNSSFPVDSHVI